MRLVPAKNESFSVYVRRIRYNTLRRILPSVRKRFELESLVGPRDCWEQLQAYQLTCLSTAGLQPHHSLLDIGCGPLAGGLKFIGYLDVGNYAGVDVRDEPLKHAYAQVAKQGLMKKNPTLVLSTTFGHDELGGRAFDYVWVSQLTYHLDDELIEELFEQMAVRLKCNGRLCCDILLEHENITDQSQWRGFAFHIRPMEFFEEIADRFGFDLICHGQLADFGYPQKVRLKRNRFVEFRKRVGAVGC